MRREPLGDDVDLAVVHFPRHLLLEQKVVKHVGKSAHGRFDFFGPDLRVIGRGRDIFVLTDLPGEGAEGGAAHVGVALVFVVVFEERIAQRILLALHGEGRELHIRELRHFIDFVRRLETLGEGREDFLGLGSELVRFLAEKVHEVMLPALGELDGALDHFVRLQKDLAVDEGQLAHDLRHHGAGAAVALLILRVVIVHGDRKRAVASDQVCFLFQFFEMREAVRDGLRVRQFPFELRFDLSGKLHAGVKIRLPLFHRRIDQAEIPGEFHRYFVTFWKFHLSSFLYQYSYVFLSIFI